MLWLFDHSRAELVFAATGQRWTVRELEAQGWNAGAWVDSRTGAAIAVTLEVALRKTLPRADRSRLALR